MDLIGAIVLGCFFILFLYLIDNAGGKKKRYRGKRGKGNKAASGEGVTARLPSTAKDFSSNWKRMMNDIAPPVPAGE